MEFVLKQNYLSRCNNASTCWPGTTRLPAQRMSSCINGHRVFPECYRESLDQLNHPWNPIQLGEIDYKYDSMKTHRGTNPGSRWLQGHKLKANASRPQIPALCPCLQCCCSWQPPCFLLLGSLNTVSSQNPLSLGPSLDKPINAPVSSHHIKLASAFHSIPEETEPFLCAEHGAAW